MIQIDVNKKYRGIRVYESGEIVITAMLAKSMNLHPGDRVAIFKEKNPSSCEELYLAKSETGIEVRQRRNRGNQRTCCIYSKQYAGTILKGDKKGIYRIGEKVNKNGVDYFTIIYKRNYGDKIQGNNTPSL